MLRQIITALCLLGLSTLTLAADAIAQTEKQATNWHAIIMFCIFVAMTMGITYWAASRTKSTSDFYTAGGGITGFQNGLAIAGDYMSAASFLGIAGLPAMVAGWIVFAVGMAAWLVAAIIAGHR